MSGELSYLGRVEDGVDSVTDLDGPSALALSSDGVNLYAGAQWGNAVSVFDRAGEGVCAATGAGDVLNETFDLAAGGSLTLEVTGTVDA
ncbi:MAG: hypothetical protein GY835_11375, partial [bacterium]|nr:hypothetical protein [bacterium]